MMQRRTFVAGMAAVMASRIAAVQSPRRIGVVSGAVALPDLDRSPYFRVFTDRLHELGWRESGDVTIERRSTEGRSERFTSIIAELLDRRVDVLVIVSQAGVVAARKLTSETPIVMVTGAQPVEGGLAANLARPGGNVTGQLSFTIHARKVNAWNSLARSFGSVLGSLMLRRGGRGTATTVPTRVLRLVSSTCR